ncbi:MAG: hypothetical protein KatS3mg109_2356 [Pirellulaceae bacterium]|nr:MAG: hypothetical protein KatS3mg109_2356 [Pirellulaceae bacterium]
MNGNLFTRYVAKRNTRESTVRFIPPRPLGWAKQKAAFQAPGWEQLKNGVGAGLHFSVVDRLIRDGGILPHVTKPANDSPAAKRPILNSPARRPS